MSARDSHSRESERAVVYKYELADQLVGWTEPGVKMPAGAQLLHIDVDPHGIPCVWALVDPDAPPARRRIEICLTGNTPVYPTHVGSFVLNRFVGHVFDGGEQ